MCGHCAGERPSIRFRDAVVCRLQGWFIPAIRSRVMTPPNVAGIPSFSVNRTVPLHREHFKFRAVITEPPCYSTNVEYTVGTGSNNQLITMQELNVMFYL